MRRQPGTAQCRPIGLIAGLALCLGVLTHTLADDIEHPVAFVWAGYDNPAFYPPYVTKYGRPPTFSLYGDEEEALQKMRAGYQPDVMLPCANVIDRWNRAGLLGTIDTALLSNWDDVIPALKNAPGGMVDGRRVMIPTDWGLTSVIYRTDIAPEYIDNESYGILWDPKYKGRLATIDSQVDGVSVAALYAGLDPFDLSLEQIEQVRALLQEQRALLRMYTSDNTSIAQSLASGEVVAALGWSTDYANLKAEGVPVAFMNPREGRMAWICGAAIHANSAHRQLAHEVIDAMISPEGGAFTITENGTGVANQRAFGLVSDAVLQSLGLDQDMQNIFDSSVMQRTQRNADAIAVMFEEVKLGL
ncbi:ABC transporter substrate-binding protein [Woeseia oceani]|nr:extracellular solute-binding protein [Woeseia oceani]